MARLHRHTHARERRARHPDQISNYELFTATTLIYAIGAGVTAAAGTRLALQWILVKGLKLFSFQLPDLEKDRHRYLSSLPLSMRIG